MTKTVFDNAMCAHVWAQQTQPKGRTNNGNMFFEGRSIYSYGYHFPLATFYKGRVILNTDNYSISTSGHQSDVRKAIGYDAVVIHADTQTIKFFADYYDDSETAEQAQQKHFTAYATKKAQELLKSAAKRKAGYLAESDINAARNAIGNAKIFFALFGLGLPEELQYLHNQIEDNRDNILAVFKEDLAKQKLLGKERAKQQAALEKEAVALWQENKEADFTPQQSAAFRQSKDIYMRIEGEEIVTSRGARFPVDHGMKAFIFIRHVKDIPKITGEQSKLLDRALPRLGHFRIDDITPQGHVKAGCHFVKWPEIERLARILKIFP